MRKNFGLFFFVMLAVAGFLFGCAKRSENEKVVARVNEYVITVADLEDEIKHSPYTANKAKTPQEMLDLAIRRLVLVQEAQKRDLDKRKDFMKTIERYWKQTLIKELLRVESEKIRQSGQTKLDEEKMFDQWTETLYKQADIKIYNDALSEVEMNNSQE